MKSERVYNACLLSAITRKKLEKNTNLKYSVILSNSAKRGIIPQNVQFDKNIANEENIDRYYVVKVGDFIYNPRISTTAPCGPINQNDCCDGVVSPLYTVFSCKPECVYDKYLKFYFQTSLWHEYIRSVANTGVRHDRMNISDKDFFSMLIKLPPIAEQRKIVEILSAQDRIIELKTKLLEEKKRLKKYLCQTFLSGKRRFPSYHEPWNKVCLSSILKEKTINCKNQNLRVYSVSVDVGVVDQIEHLGRSYAARDISKYTVVEKGDVIYTKSPTGLFPFGIVKQSQMDASGAVSPLYAVYSPKSIELGYLLHTYFSYPLNTTNYLKSLIQRGPKNTMSISNSDFLKKALHLPVDKDEIARLSDLFKQIDIEIRITANNIEQENLKKKALTQQLLTGKIRVTV